MGRKKNILQKLLHLSAKPLAALVVLVLVFSPLQQISIAQASHISGHVDDQKPAGCSFSPSDWDLCLTSVVYAFTVGLGSGFAYVAAAFLDLAVALSLSSLSYALEFIASGWEVVRDVANMFFILILIYIAFAIMLSAESVGTMRTLVLVIFVALIVNFSFFFTRVIVDGGNILAVQFYNAIQAPPMPTTFSVGGEGNRLVGSVQAGVGAAASTLRNGKDLTEPIMKLLQFQNLYNLNSFTEWRSKQGFLVVVITLSFLYILTAIMLGIMTVMFVTVGVKFLIRVVALWFLIIASPLAFVAATIPQTKGYFSQWRDQLIKYSLFPAIFLFMFLILVNFANQLGACPNQVGAAAPNINCSGSILQSTFDSLQTNTSNAADQGTPFLAPLGLAFANIGIRLGLIIALLFIALKASEQISLQGAEAAGKIGSKVGGWYSGALKWAGKQPIRGATYVGKGAGGVLYRESIGRKAASLASSLKDRGRFGYGISQRLSKVADSKVGGAASYTDAEKYRGERARYSTNQEDLQWMLTNKAAYQAAKKKSVAARSAGEQTLVDEGDRVKNRMKGFREPDLDSLKFKEIKALSDVLTADQLKVIQGSKKLSENEKEEFTTDWNTHNSASAYQKANKEVDEIRKLATELHGLGVTLARVDHHIGGAATPARPGSLIDKDTIKDMQKEAKRQMANLDSTIATQARGGHDTTDLREKRDKIRETIDHMGKLETERGNVQANIGDEREEGKFKTIS